MNIFSKTDTVQNEISFDVAADQPNSVTIAAMLEAERISNNPSVRFYDDVDEFLADLKK